MSGTEPRFMNPSPNVWELEKDGYTVTLTVNGDRTLAVVRNSRGEEVDSTTLAGRSGFREARWMLGTAIESGE